MADKKWCVYLVECMDGSLYTGVTNDVLARMKAHISGKGSKYVRAKGFGRLVGRKECADRADALKKEYEIKQLSREDKISYLSS